MDEDKVFKALADPSRRLLLDLLYQKNGQTLTQLEAHLNMTRFGVMKHLHLLEEAGLITTRKIGREKFHYLNPVPIQMVYERWVSKYAQPWTQTLVNLKHVLEEYPMTTKPNHVFEIFIRTTPEKLWQALTDGTMTSQYYFGTRVESAWTQGSLYRYVTPENTNLLEGEIIEIDPPKRMVCTFRPLWQAEAAHTQSRVTWEIEPMGNVCKLTLIHDELDAHPTVEGIIAGWGQILSGLKTLLETGEPLVIR